jgi:hypothetical protein
MINAAGKILLRILSMARLLASRGIRAVPSTRTAAAVALIASARR